MIIKPLLMLALACAACAQAVPPGDGGDGVRLVNESGGAVLYLAMTADQAALVDPNPEWRIEEHLDRLLEPGQAREIRLDGYAPGDDLVILVYDVPGTARTGTVRLSRMIRVTGGELSQARGRIVIPPR